MSLHTRKFAPGSAPSDYRLNIQLLLLTQLDVLLLFLEKTHAYKYKGAVRNPMQLIIIALTT